MVSAGTNSGEYFIKVFERICDLCGCCAGICPEDAIEITRVHLFIKDKKCTACKKCVWSCPLEALALLKKDQAA